jgi:ATP-dependent exoDNAse (exonuclease V) alpha subunit
MTENVRQADEWERRALADLREGRTAEAVSAYIAHDAVVTGKRLETEVLGQLIHDYRAAVEQGRDTIMLTHRRADVDTLNRMAHTQAAARGQLEGPTLTVGSLAIRRDGSVELPKEFRAGDVALCLENDHERGLTNGMRVQVIAVDPALHSVTLRTPDSREVSVDVRHYDAIDHGYAMTVHKAQGLSVDVSLVLARGDEGREWTYTAMSRGREDNVYYTSDAPPLRDEHGTHLHEERADELAERLEQSWSRSEAADSTLDYERIEERLESRRLLHEASVMPWTEPSHAISPSVAVFADRYDAAEHLSPGDGGPSPF